MTLSQAAQAELASDERIYSDSQVVYAGFTLKQLQDAFEKALRPGQYWKDSIKTLCTADQLSLVQAAIEFHVGGPTSVTPTTFTHQGATVELLVLDNAGYWSNIGA